MLAAAARPRDRRTAAVECSAARGLDLHVGRVLVRVLGLLEPLDRLAEHVAEDAPPQLARKARAKAVAHHLAADRRREREAPEQRKLEHVLPQRRAHGGRVGQVEVLDDAAHQPRVEHPDEAAKSAHQKAEAKAARVRPQQPFPRRPRPGLLRGDRGEAALAVVGEADRGGAIDPAVGRRVERADLLPRRPRQPAARGALARQLSPRRVARGEPGL